MSVVDIKALIENLETSSIRPDIPLDKIGKYLGPPGWWNFSSTEPFSALLGYGDFQVELWLVGRRVEVRRIGLQLWDASEGEPVPKRGRIRISKGIKVDLSGYTPGADLQAVKEKLYEKEITFSEVARDDATEIKAVITVGTGTQLLFFSMEGHIGLAEIQVMSRHSGA
jgi:hypothetical protein